MVKNRKTDYAMFSDEGNLAVKKLVDQMIDNGEPIEFHRVISAFGKVGHSEATDTAVRDEVFETLAKLGLVADVRKVAVYPDRWPEPISS